MNVNRAFKRALQKAGEPFEVEREEAGFEVTAIKNDKTKQFQLEPDAGVGSGDWLRSKISGKRFYIVDTDVQLVQMVPIALLADYKTESEFQPERESRASQGPVYNIQQAIGSNIGVEGHAEIRANYTFGNLEAEIHQRTAGEEQEILLRMVREIRDMLEDGQGLEPGSLEQYSEQIERHSWIASPLATMILTYLITGQFS